MTTSKIGFSGTPPAGASDTVPEASETRVLEVKVRHSVVIDQIQFVHQTLAGARKELGAHGANGGTLETFSLAQDEYITKITGTCAKAYTAPGLQTYNVVASLQIVTNKKTSKVYGQGGGPASYSFEAPEGSEIAGFYGRAGQFVDAIGAVVRTRSTTLDLGKLATISNPTTQLFFQEAKGYVLALPKLDTLSQKWTITPTGEIKSSLGNFALDLQDVASSPWYKEVVVKPLTGSATQKWEISANGVIKNVSTGWAISAEPDKDGTLAAVVYPFDLTKPDPNKQVWNVTYL